MSKAPYKSENAFKQRLHAHLFFSAIWASCAKDASDRLNSTPQHQISYRDHLEKFIERAIQRSLRHYREADAVRQRGFL